MKFSTKPIQHCPPHLKYVAALPGEIRSTNLVKITNAFYVTSFNSVKS